MPIKVGAKAEAEALGIPRKTFVIAMRGAAMPIRVITPEEADVLGIPRSTTIIQSVPVRRKHGQTNHREGPRRIIGA